MRIRNRKLQTDRIAMLRQIALYVVFLGAVLLAPTSAYAQCSVSVANISFGNVNVLPGTAVDVTGSMSLSCSGMTGTNPGSKRFCISVGSGLVVSGSQRQLASFGGGRLNFDLYKDAARTQLWGSWQTGFNTAGLQINFTTNSSGNITASVPIYARLFASQQTAPPGGYLTWIPSNSSGAYVRYGQTTATCDTGTSNTSTSFFVSATVVSTCYVTASNISFGSVGLVTSNVDSSSTVTARCNTSVPYTVSLSGGNAGATDPTQRKMAKASETVTYGLYRDAARVQPWGSTIGTDTVAGTGTGVAQNITIYGRVPAQVTGSPGNYSDTIVATITY
jgi:spore coat protein U-like protein